MSDDKTQIGGVNLSDLKDSDTRTGDIDASVHAGRDIIIYNYYTQAEAPTPAPPVETGAEPIPDNPYRGLFIFRPEHAKFFFGREAYTERLVKAVESRRLVTVLGASGSGKSSVVFAGLVPALVQRAGEPWLFSTFRPGDDPFQNLAAALVPLYETGLSKTDQLVATRKLSAGLHAGDLPLADVLASIRDTQPDHRLLLIADQFEELYTLCRDAGARHTFLDLLLAPLQTSHSPFTLHNSPFTLVLTLRADFLGQASLYRPLADALQGTTELLGPMTREELSRAIEQPAKVQGVTFEDKLVERLLDDVGQAEGSLPLLEFALSELWQRQQQRTLSHVAYDEIGEVKGALSRHADRAYAELTEAEKEQARRVLVQLVNPGAGTEDTRRLATRRDLEPNWDLVAKLASERLVVTNRVEEGLETVEVVHEALIRDWPQLRHWLAADREFLTWQLGLRADLARWEATGHDEGALLHGAPLALAEEKARERPADLTGREQAYIQASLAQQQRQKKRQQLIFAGAITAALVMAMLAVFSLFQWQDASRQRAALAELNEKAQAELNFYQTTDPAERLAELYHLFSRPDADSQARARSLFFGLRRVEQLDLLAVTERPEELAAVGRAILPNLADINGIYYTNEHLTTLADSLTDEALKQVVVAWLAAREAAQAEDYDLALRRYTDLLASNDQNPALWYERARLQAKRGQAAEALAGLATVMNLARAPEYESRGVLPVGLEFADSQQMAKAVERLILVYADLAAEYKAAAADYPSLAEITLPTLKTDDWGVPMILIPAGAFNMGSNTEYADSDEQPVHKVYLDSYYIDQYEVTNAQFVAFLQEQGNRTEGGVRWLSEEGSRISRAGSAWRIEPPNYEAHPVTGVSWYGAKAYCAWRGGRLPTEAEWEKAARGDDERTYPWGEQIACHLANYSDCGTNETTPVGRYPEGISPYGVYDLAGNVWEWVADAYDSEYYRESPFQNPTDPEDEQNERSKVLRGGSWSDNVGRVRASYRSSYNPASQSDIFGFRCVGVSPE